jgi:hypothetical protein
MEPDEHMEAKEPRDVMYFTQAPKLAVPRNPNELNQVALQRYGC